MDTKLVTSILYNAIDSNKTKEEFIWKETASASTSFKWAVFYAFLVLHLAKVHSMLL